MDGVDFSNKNMYLESWNKYGNQHENQNKTNSNLFGMTCDGRDIIATNFTTPDMNVGDWLIFGGMGSYTVGPKS